MRILLLTTHMRIGGIGVYTVTLANALQRKGHIVFVASVGGELEKELSPGIKVVRIPMGTKSIVSPKITASVFKLWGLVKEEKIEVIHAQTRVAQFAACMLTSMTKVPSVATWHGFYRPHFFRKILPCWGEITIAISRTVYEHLKNDFKRDEGKIRLIFNGVDVSKFSRVYSDEEKKAIKKKYGLNDGPVIGIISRLSEEKGHMVLLDAFKDLLAEMLGAQLLIVGEGRLGAGLKARALELGIDKNVHFFGNTLNTIEFLAIMDVFTRPSIQEGFGLGVIEAMLMGVPVVSTDVGGFKSILNHGEVGILVEPLNAARLKEGIKKVLSDEKFAKNISAAARQYAASNFSADRMAQQVEAVYKEVMCGAK